VQSARTGTLEMPSVETQFVEGHGARIPAIGLGTWELASGCARVVEQAIRLGYRHIDTAQIYDNEREVGDGIRSSHIRRDQLFVTTKVWNTHFAPNDLLRSAKDSLVKLRLSEVDLLLLHWPNSHVPLNETLGALAQARELGITRHIGVAHFTVALLGQAVAASPAPIVCNQVEYHPFLDQAKVRAACAEHGVAMVAFSPLANGGFKKAEVLSAIATAHGKSAAQVCLRWLVQQNVAAIPRTTRIERLSQNIDVFDFALTDSEMQQIFALGSPKGRLVKTPTAPQWD
jgi:2,5-diketo-D-gluconate reductase B